jgi:hypothetical protein
VKQRVSCCHFGRRNALRRLCGTFHPFALRPTGIYPRYQTVPDCDKNRIELFANIDLGRKGRPC